MKKVLVSLLMALLVVPSIAQTDKDHDFKMAKNMDIFNAIYKNLDLMYVDTLDADEVVGNGVKAMLGSLDPYTTYYPEQKMKELKNLLTGRVEITSQNHGFCVDPASLPASVEVTHINLNDGSLEGMRHRE